MIPKFKFLSEENYLSKIFKTKLGFDFNKGRIDKSRDYPCGGTTNDIRITTRFNKMILFLNFDVFMHEIGHGLYNTFQGSHCIKIQRKSVYRNANS